MSAAICLRLSCPNSGTSPNSVVVNTGPTPGTLRNRLSFSRHTGLSRSVCAKSFSTAPSCARNHRTCWSICRWIGRGARLRRCSSASSISTSCRRRRSHACRLCVIVSGSGRTGGRTTSAKCANTPASIASVFANRPVARAKSRTCRALSTTTGSAAVASAATTATSYPPVASSTISEGADACSRSCNCASPTGLLVTVHRAPLGRTTTSSSAFATSIPTKPPASVIAAPFARACRCGLPGPGNCSGFLEDAAWRPSLPHGLCANLRRVGLPRHSQDTSGVAPPGTPHRSHDSGRVPRQVARAKPIARTTVHLPAHEAVEAIALPCSPRALRRRPIAAAAGGLDQEHVAFPHGDPDFLGLQDAHRPTARLEPVAVGETILAAEQTIRGVTHSITRSVRDRRLLDVHPEAQDGADAAAVHPLARGIGPELVVLEGQREARLRHLHAAELDPAGGLPLAGRLPSVADHRRAAAGAGVEHVPDERLPRSWIDALDRDAEAPPPSGDRALGTGGRPRPDCRPRDFLGPGGRRRGGPGRAG